MDIFGKTLLIPLFLAGIILASCSSSLATPTPSGAEIMQTAMATVSTGLAETQPALPTATATTSGLLPTISFLTVIPAQTPLTPMPTLTTDAYLILDVGDHNVWNGPGINFKAIGYAQSPKKYPVIGKYLDWWLIDLDNHRYG